MKPRDDENVISGRLLKCEHHVRIHKCAVAQQHRSQYRQAIRLACKKSVEAPEKISASARKSLQNRWRRAIDEPQQFAAPNRTNQIDFLAREIAVKIERAGIKEISRRPRANQNFHAISRAQVLGQARSLLRAAIEIGTQAAACGNRLAHRFHLFQVDFVPPAPRHHEWVFAEPSSPAERLRQIKAVLCDQPRNVIRRHGRTLNPACKRAERDPGGNCAYSRRNNSSAPEQNAAAGERHRHRDNAQERLLRPPACCADARCECCRDPERWKFHSRRRSRVTASM